MFLEIGSFKHCCFIVWYKCVRASLNEKEIEVTVTVRIWTAAEKAYSAQLARIIITVHAVFQKNAHTDKTIRQWNQKLEIAGYLYTHKCSRESSPSEEIVHRVRNAIKRSPRSQIGGWDVHITAIDHSVPDLLDNRTYLPWNFSCGDLSKTLCMYDFLPRDLQELRDRITTALAEVNMATATWMDWIR